MKTFFKICGFILLTLIVIAILVPNDNSSSGSVSANGSASTVSDPVEEVSKPALEILQHDATYEDIMESYTVHVKVRNNSDDLIQYVDLKSVFYDKGGRIVGTGLGNAANIAAGATKTIDVMALGIQEADKYEVEVGTVMY